jgi:hypothetical protein
MDRTWHELGSDLIHGSQRQQQAGGMLVYPICRVSSQVSWWWKTWVPHRERRRTARISRALLSLQWSIHQRECQRTYARRVIGLMACRRLVPWATDLPRGASSSFCFSKLSVERLPKHIVRSFHNRFAQGRMGMHSPGHLIRGQFPGASQDQLG